MDWSAFKISLALGVVTLLVLMPFATMLARLLAWRRFTGRGLLEAAIAMPLVLPPTVLGFYLLEGFARDGWLGRLFGIFSGETLAFSFSGLVIASIIVNLPFAVQPLQRAFEAVPANVREAAWVSGLGNWQTFWRIELPLAWPGFVSAIALTFAHTLGEFGVVLMVGGNIPGETRTASVAIYDAVQAFETAAAGRMAALLLAISCVAMLVINLTASRQRKRAHG